MATTKATTKKKTTKSSSARRKSSRRKSAKSTEQLRKEAIADIDKNLANADGKVETKAKATKKASATKVNQTLASAKAEATTNSKKSATKRSPGILDHAASILAASKEPMFCKAIVQQAMEKHGWTTSGRTPHATLYAAIIREISKKGKDARFTKVDRGRFTANTNTSAKGA